MIWLLMHVVTPNKHREAYAEECMKLSDWQNVAIVGYRNKKIEKIGQILIRYFNTVITISDLSELTGPLSRDAIDLIIITDSLREKPDDAMASKLRRLFPDSKILGLFDRIDPETERVLRSIGLIFLGSYDLFINQIITIIRPTERIKEQPAKELEWNRY